ncbi:MAG: hypothetical protein ACYDH4_13295 [Candidatus Cryosericum sp.]
MTTLTASQRAFWFTFALIAYHTGLREWASTWAITSTGGLLS